MDLMKLRFDFFFFKENNIKNPEGHIKQAMYDNDRDR
jgi:hypothetical protein